MSAQQQQQKKKMSITRSVVEPLESRQFFAVTTGVGEVAPTADGGDASAKEATENGISIVIKVSKPSPKLATDLAKQPPKSPPPPPPTPPITIVLSDVLISSYQ